jgi:hypothetical protein
MLDSFLDRAKFVEVLPSVTMFLNAVKQAPVD